VIAVNSLRLRLLAGAVISISLALAVAGTLLAALFRAHVERRLEAELTIQLEQIAAALESPGPGRVILTHRPTDPRFRKAYSGSYWQVDGPDGPIFRSPSLWDVALRLHLDGAPDGGVHRLVHRHRIAGPDGQKLIALERTVTLPDAPGAYRVVAATDERELTVADAAFTRTLALSLGILALALVAAVTIQVRVGLKPLQRLRAGVAAIREGRIKRLEGPFPTETQPLVEDLNALLERNEEIVARGRIHAGNLAHGLKTPLSVLANEVDRLAADGAPQLAASMRGQIATMQRQIDYQLARARAAAAVDVPGARVPVASSVAAVQRTLARLYLGRSLQFVIDIPADHVFRGEQQDLEEMLGNLMDNACKWARRRVAATSRRDDGRLTITIDDDGPGLPPEQLRSALAPGARFDETVPGTGLGLAIVRDLANLYGGSIALGSGSLGGLRAELTLPAG
jgi:signal transduction histidine kinase